jgi:predicted RNA-binding Zn ribbon-like protein
MLLGGEKIVDGVTGASDGRQQPGGRAAAPGELGLLQAFVNTHFDLVEEFGFDLFATPAGLKRWLIGHRLAGRRAVVTTADLDRTLVVREGLRELIACHDPATVGAARGAAINRALAGASLELRFTSRGTELVSTGSSGIERALGSLLAILAHAMMDDSWLRLKVCPGSHCGWVFYDHSRNNSGRWCSMRVCGGREKARAHYRRQRGR